MKVRLPERFNFVMGNITLSYGGGFPGWGWLVRGLADPYSRRLGLSAGPVGRERV